MADKHEMTASDYASEPVLTPFSSEMLLWPVSMSLAAWRLCTNIAETWWKFALMPAYHHSHEGHAQLEVPDPIERADEQDLFA